MCRLGLVAVALVFVCAGCTRDRAEREQAEWARNRRRALRLLDRVEREGWHGELSPSARRLLFQYARFASDEMAARAIRSGDRNVQGLMARLLEMSELVHRSRESSFVVKHVGAAISSKESKRYALILHRNFLSHEGVVLALSLLEDPDPEIRMWAVGSLCNPQYHGVEVAEEVVRHLRDPDRRVALTAAEGLCELRHPHVARLLREHAETVDDPGVRESALKSASQIERHLQWKPTLPDWAKKRYPTSPRPPEPFRLLIPADGAEGVPSIPTFTWEEARYALHYELTVSRDISFTSCVAGMNHIQTNEYRIWDENRLAPATWYYWRVKALNHHGETVNAGGPWRFRTASAEGGSPTPPDAKGGD